MKFRHNLAWLQPVSLIVSVNDNETARVNEGCQVSSKSPSLTRAFEEVISKKTDEIWFKSFVKSWQLTPKLDSDHTCVQSVRSERDAAGPQGSSGGSPPRLQHRLLCPKDKKRGPQAAGGGHQGRTLFLYAKPKTFLAFWIFLEGLSKNWKFEISLIGQR